MAGVSSDTAQMLADPVHLAQSIRDILITPTGTRVMRRAYGSELPQLIDAPINGATSVDLFMAVAEALDRWEPRYILRRVQIDEARAGYVALRLTGEYRGIEEVLSVNVGDAA